MSQENVEVANVVVRQFLWAFENDADAFRTPSYGIEAALRNRSQWFDTWGEHRLDLEDVIEHGNNVVASVHITARGEASGVEVDVRFHAHFKVRDGKVVYIFDHEDKAAALEAAGLAE
jgi:ketosteroid isomerase-like protein